jgi:hypothetical protein
MEYIDEATWATTLGLGVSAGKELHYKFLIRRGATFVREPGRGHHRQAPASEHEIWRDTWRS